MTRRLPRALPFLAIAALLLTACTGDGADGGGGDDAAGTQSVAAACATIDETLTEAAGGLQQLDPADPAAATATMQTIADGVAEAAASVDNAEVAALLPDLESGFRSAAEAMTALAAGDASRAAELSAAVGEVQSSITAFGELCDGS